MKKGDSLRVFIENIEVSKGEITAVREGEIEVTVPGFVSVIATRTSLSTEPTSYEEAPTKEIHVTGIDVVDADGNVISSHNDEPAPANADSTAASTVSPAPESISSAQSPVENKTSGAEASTASSTSNTSSDHQAADQTAPVGNND